MTQLAVYREWKDLQFNTTKLIRKIVCLMFTIRFLKFNEKSSNMPWILPSGYRENIPNNSILLAKCTFFALIKKNLSISQSDFLQNKRDENRDVIWKLYLLWQLAQQSVYPKCHFVFLINRNMKLEIKFWFSFLY